MRDAVSLSGTEKTLDESVMTARACLSHHANLVLQYTGCARAAHTLIPRQRQHPTCTIVHAHASTSPHSHQLTTTVSTHSCRVGLPSYTMLDTCCTIVLRPRPAVQSAGVALEGAAPPLHFASPRLAALKVPRGDVHTRPFVERSWSVVGTTWSTHGSPMRASSAAIPLMGSSSRLSCARCRLRPGIGASCGSSTPLRLR